MAGLQFFDAKIKAIRALSDEIFEYRLDIAAAFTWAAGAHLHIGLPGFNEGGQRNRDLIHHLSLVSLCEDGDVIVISRIPLGEKSTFKQVLSKLHAGDTVTLFKVQSMLTLDEDANNIFILQGIGIAPAVALIRHASEQGKADNIELLHVARPSEHVYREQIESYIGSTACQWIEGRAALESAVKATVEKNKGLNCKYILVGSADFVRCQIELLRDLGVSDEAIVLDKKPAKCEEFFRWMDEWKLSQAHSQTRL